MPPLTPPIGCPEWAHRLAHWLDEAERNPDTFRWYAGEPTDVAPESHRFAIEFIGSLMDKNVLKPPGPR